MKTGLLLLLTLSALSSTVHADAIKCRMPNGKVVITDGACTGGSSVEQVRSSEYISPERQRQAHEVNARTAAQVEGIEAEKAADRAALQNQQRAVAAQDARQASIRAQQDANDNLKRQRDDCDQLATNKNMGRSQRAALSEICAKPETDNKRFTDCKEQIARATSPSQRAMIASTCTGDPQAGERVREVSRPASSTVAPSTITSCDRGGCWDNVGNRYNGSGGTMFRSDGKTCQKIGNMMQCN